MIDLRAVVIDPDHMSGLRLQLLFAIAAAADEGLVHPTPSNEERRHEVARALHTLMPYVMAVTELGERFPLVLEMLLRARLAETPPTPPPLASGMPTVAEPSDDDALRVFVGIDREVPRD